MVFCCRFELLAYLSSIFVLILAENEIHSANETFYQTTSPRGDWKAITVDYTGQHIVTFMDSQQSSHYDVVISMDYGYSWEKTYSVASSYCYGQPASLTSDSSGKYVILAYCYASYSSHDYGQTWYSIPAGYYWYALASSYSGSVVISSAFNVLFQSVDYGYRWAEIYQVSNMKGIACDSDCTQIVVSYCFGYNDQGHIAVGNGTHWNTTTVATVSGCSTSPIVSDGSGQHLAVAFNNVFYRSSDAGATWRSSVFNGVTILSLAGDEAGRVLVMGCRTYDSHAEVLHSFDYGETWSRVEKLGVLATLTFVVAVSGNGQLAVVGGGQDSDRILVSSDPYYERTVEVIAEGDTVDYAFTGLGVVFVPMYLSVSVLVSSSSSASLSVYTSEGVPLLMDVFCMPTQSCHAVADPVPCSLNLPVNSSLVKHEAGGSLGITVVLANAAAHTPCVINGTEATFALKITLSKFVVSSDSTATLKLDSTFVFSLLVCCAALAGVVAALVLTARVRKTVAVSTSWSYAEWSVNGLYLGCEIAVMVVLAGGDRNWRDLALAVLLVRLSSVLLAVYFLVFVVGWTKLALPYHNLLHREHMRLNRFVSLLLKVAMLADPVVLRYFPWHESEFSKKHLGFPDASTYDLCVLSRVLQGLFTMAVQVEMYRYYETCDDKSAVTSGVLGLIVLYTAASVLRSVGYVCHFVAVYAIPALLASVQHACASSADATVRLWRKASQLDLRHRFASVKSIRNVPARVTITCVKLLLALIGFAVLYRPDCADNYNTFNWGPLSFLIMVDMGAVLIISYLIILLVEAVLILEYDGFDPHLEMVRVARSFSLDANKITTILESTLVFFSVLEFLSVCIAIAMPVSFMNMFHRTPACKEFKKDPWDSLETTVYVMLAMIELYTPVMLHAVDVWNVSQSREKATKALLRLDICAVCNFLKAMQTIVFPLSILSSISIFNTRRIKEKLVKNSKPAEIQDGSTEGATGQPDSDSALDDNSSAITSKLLSFQLRDNWANVDGAKGERDDSWTAIIFAYLHRLSKRFTILYSFTKLCGTIAFTMIVNPAYLNCSTPGAYHHAATCEVSLRWQTMVVPIYSDDSTIHCQSSTTCAAFCPGTQQYPTIITYPNCTGDMAPPTPPIDWTCSVDISSQCLCNNWLLFQFVVIVLHVVHYGVQCYFFIRYNYFDPQQNQIDCVETYTFAGENLALFLTHPSICFLSVLEAISIVLVWVEVAVRPGGSCLNAAIFDVTNFSFQFAMFVTFVEVYKANVSTFGKLVRGGHYWWAVWGLVRLDLFVFYGFTLFLQSFFFPFSLLGHSLSGYSPVQAELSEKDKEEEDKEEDRVKAGGDDEVKSVVKAMLVRDETQDAGLRWAE